MPSRGPGVLVGENEVRERVAIHIGDFRGFGIAEVFAFQCPAAVGLGSYQGSTQFEKVEWRPVRTSSP